MRGKAAPKRRIKVDPRYNSPIVAKFINYIMEDGKKSVAQDIVYKCFSEIEKKIKAGEVDKVEFPNALAVFDQVVKNVAPQIEVRSKRIGGGNYQIPYPVRGERKFFLALNWLIEAARKKGGRPMHVRLLDELMGAFRNEGESIKKKADVHRMAEANRAFAHFAKY